MPGKDNKKKPKQDKSKKVAPVAAQKQPEQKVVAQKDAKKR